MNTTVSMPSAAPDAPIEELIKVMIERLRTVAKVVEGEHNWLKPQLDFTKKMDDDDIKYGLEQGHYTDEEAAEKMAEYHLLLRRDQADKHLANLNLAPVYINDVAGMLEAIFGTKAEVQS